MSKKVQNEIDRAKDQFDTYEENIKSMTLDRMNQAPKEDVEPQTKLSSSQIEKSKDIYLKPEKSLGAGVNPKTGEREKFNENFREQYEFAKQYVQFIAENKELIGEAIEIWTKPFPGMQCEYWRVPTNKPVWGPRYLAEQIKRKAYHRLRSEENVITSADGMGKWSGQITVDNMIQRLDANPVSTRKSIFMGVNNF